MLGKTPLDNFDPAVRALVEDESVVPFGVMVTASILMASEQHGKPPIGPAEAQRLALLQFAATSGDKKLAQRLIDAGADPNADMGMETFLMTAARNGRIGVVRVLLDAGADPHATTSPGGYVAAQLASSHGYEEIRELLDGGPPLPRNPEPSLFGGGGGGGGDRNGEEEERPATAPEDFAAVVDELERIAGVAATELFAPWGDVVGVEFEVYEDAALRIVEAHQDAMRRRGVFVFCYSGDVESDRLAAVPTGDLPAAVGRVGTDGANWKIRNEAIVAWLRDITKTHPVRVTAIGSNKIDGTFLEPLDDVDAMAARVTEICPMWEDDPDALVELLTTERKLRLYWD